MRTTYINLFQRELSADFGATKKENEIVYLPVSVKDELPGIEQPVIAIVIDEFGDQASYVSRLLADGRWYTPFRLITPACWLKPVPFSSLIEDKVKEFIDEIKKEFKDKNWDYLDFIAERLKNNK